MYNQCRYDTNLKAVDSMGDGETVVGVESLGLEVSFLIDEHRTTTSCCHLVVEIKKITS